MWCCKKFKDFVFWEKEAWMPCKSNDERPRHGERLYLLRTEYLTC